MIKSIYICDSCGTESEEEVPERVSTFSSLAGYTTKDTCKICYQSYNTEKRNIEKMFERRMNSLDEKYFGESPKTS